MYAHIHTRTHIQAHTRTGMYCLHIKINPLPLSYTHTHTLVGHLTYIELTFEGVALLTIKCTLTFSKLHSLTAYKTVKLTVRACQYERARQTERCRSAAALLLLRHRESE